MKDGVRGCGCVARKTNVFIRVCCVEDGEGEGSAMSASNTFQSN